MFRSLYLETRAGRWALYAAFSAVFIAGYLTWSRPPSLQSMTHDLGVFEPCGDRYKHVFAQLVGQRVEVWSKDDVVYQITTGSTQVIDRDTRVREVHGNPRVQYLYGGLCLLVFAVLTFVRYRQISATSTPGGPLPDDQA